MGRITAVALSLFVCGCSGGESPSIVRSASSGAGGCKPEAPVDVVITARAIGTDTHRVELRGTPTGAVDGVDLMLALPAGADVVAGDRRRLFGKTAAGTSRALTADVRITGPGAIVAGSARLTFSGIAPSKVVELELGHAVRPPPAATRSIATPSGEIVDEEVRP